ncbi:MAG: ATP synthase F1 subunit gamma [Candidatus Riflebacteria bacterium]|nr:ATP synthase F1 subunit gamma [Candidatus Riflebacteria bacterium]
MPNIRDIKKKTLGVKNTQQITRAMKMVSTAKLRQATIRLNATMLYLRKLEQMTADVREVLSTDSPIQTGFDHRPVKNIGVVVVAGERGLCGSFNSDIFKFSMSFLNSISGTGSQLFLIGNKARDYFKRYPKLPVIGFDFLINSNSSVDVVRKAARHAINCYTSKKIDELWIIFSEFVSILERRLTKVRLLPIDSSAKGGKIGKSEKKRVAGELIFDPSPEKLLSDLIPRYVEGLFMRALLESAASEQSARMIAMGAATDRAEDIIEQLTLTYNRTRQALITKELSEVIAGADSLAN